MNPKYSRRQFIKAASFGTYGLAVSQAFPILGRATTSPFPGKYEADWDSLSRYTVPPWFRDAKLGAFIVWGPYAVPAYGNEWYPRNMYLKSDPVFEWHRQHWGPQSKFGYKDFIPLFRGERWSPDDWVDLFKKAGVKYIVQIADFHDGFPMYNSDLTEWNSARMGPCRDVVGELARESLNQRLKFGVSSHRAFHWSFYTYDKEFDTANPLYAGLYGPIHAPTPLISHDKDELRQTASPEFLQDWFARSVEVVNRYRPDLFYFDFGIGAPEFEPYRQQFGAYYYNMAGHWDQEVVITYKYNAYPEHAAVLDFERGLADAIRPLPWQTDTSVSWKSWGYIDNDSFKSPAEIVREFIDIVSKNGNLLLSVGPRADGTIPEEAENIYRQLGSWLEVNGEAIYATRPWALYGEGPTTLHGGAFAERKEVAFTSQDIRFTTKADAIYAIFMDWPGPNAAIKSLGSRLPHAPRKISSVTMLGVAEPLEWHQTPEALTISIPPVKRPCEHAYVFKVVGSS